MKTLKKRLEEEPHYMEGNILVYPIIVTESIWKKSPELVEFDVWRHLYWIRGDSYKSIDWLRDKTIEVRILSDTDPPEGLKKLADKYGIKIEVNPKRIEKIRKEMIEKFEKRRKKTKRMGYLKF